MVYSPLMLVFLFGGLLESIWLARFNLKRWFELFLASVALVAIMGFIELVTGKLVLQPAEVPVATVFYVLLFFMPLFFAAFKDLLSSVSEKSLLAVTLILWYVFIVSLPAFGVFAFYAALLLSVGTVCVLFICFTDGRLGTFTKSFLYCWYLLVMVCLLVFSSWQAYAFILEPASWSLPWLAQALVSGMAIFYLAFLAFQLLLLLPGEDNTFENIREHLVDLSKHVRDEQAGVRGSVLITALFAAVLLSNYFFNLISPALLVGACVLFSNFFVFV